MSVKEAEEILANTPKWTLDLLEEKPVTKFRIHKKMQAEAAVPTEPETEGERKLREGMEEVKRKKEQQEKDRAKRNKQVKYEYKIK